MSWSGSEPQLAIISEPTSDPELTSDLAQSTPSIGISWILQQSQWKVVSSLDLRKINPGRQLIGGQQ